MFARFLSQVRHNTIRSEVWYRALDRAKRGILSISAKIIDAEKSNLKKSKLVKIGANLRNAFKSSFLRHFKPFSIWSIKVIQGQAYSFGYLGAKELSKT